MVERDPDEELTPDDFGLTQLECDFLVAAIGQFGGPASSTDPAASLLHFEGAAAMSDGLKRINGRLRKRMPLSRLDWRRAQVAAELSFGSDTYGAGVEWETVTGLDDCESLLDLRRVQRKLVGVCPLWAID